MSIFKLHLVVKNVFGSMKSAAGYVLFFFRRCYVSVAVLDGLIYAMVIFKIVNYFIGGEF